MVELTEFAIEVVALSASGVIAPGPLFVANMFYGAKQGTMMSGVRMAHGHALVEIAAIAAIATGFFSTSAFVSENARTITIMGFAGLQVFIYDSEEKRNTPHGRQKRALVMGVALTALNPFFLLWWLTIELKLVADSAAFGTVTGVALLFAFHIWMDYAWLAATAYFASRGGSVLHSKYYRLLMYRLAACLHIMGCSFF